MTKVHATIAELRSGVVSPTGDTRPLIIKRPNVALELDWDEAAIAHFPADLSFSLTVRGLVQDLPQRRGQPNDGRVRVAFRWDADEITAPWA